jgi:hypothetical protein
MYSPTLRRVHPQTSASARACGMLLLIDNYDSFTWNLVHYLGELGAEVKVVRNDALDVQAAMALRPAGIVLSPGPCDPDQAGICLPLTLAAAEAGTPLLGVCLGHQTIGRPSAARSCAAMKSCMARWAPCTTRAKACSRACPRPFRPRAIIRWSWNAPPCPIALRSRPGWRMARSWACATAPADRRRAVPPRKHRLGTRPPDAAQLPDMRRLPA